MNKYVFRENTHNIRNFQIISKEKKNGKLCEKHYHIGHLSLGSSLGEFKRKITDYKCETCFCRLWQTYHQKIRCIIENEIFISIFVKKL